MRRSVGSHQRGREDKATKPISLPGVQVMAKARRTPRHQDTAWRSITPAAGHDDWQRQADAAAWAAVSGLPATLYLGAIEPIPIPPNLRRQLREAGQALAAEPSHARADALLRLAHLAVYGTPDPTPPLESHQKPKDGAGSDWWANTADDAETPPEATQSAAAMVRHVEEALAALQASEWTPEDGGEAEAGGWWD